MPTPTGNKHKSSESSNTEFEQKKFKWSFVLSVCALIISVIAIIVPYRMSCLMLESSEKTSADNLASSNNLNSIIETQNEIMKKHEAALAEISRIMGNMRDITSQYNEIIQKEYRLSEANLEIRCPGGVIFPKDYFVEFANHAGADIAKARYVVLAMVTLRNNSKYPISVAGMKAEIGAEEIYREFCFPAALVSPEEDVLLLVNPKLFQLQWGNVPNDEKRLFENILKVDSLPKEYPLTFDLQPFQEKRGFVSFHTDNLFAEEHRAMKLKINTNRGIFESNVDVEKDTFNFKPLPKAAELIVCDYLEELANENKGENKLKRKVIEAFGNLTDE